MKRSILIFVITGPCLICQTPTTITIASSANPSLFGQAITLSASVKPPQATGRVTFYDGITILGAATIANGNAGISTILPASGVRKLKARFVGGAVYGSSSSSALAQTVSVVPATTLQAPVGYPTASTFNQHVAVADFNGDGHLDIVTNNNTILMGNGDGTFRTPVIYTSAKNSYSVVTGDFNGDGKPDFATAGYDVGIWLNRGDGTFQPPVFYPIPALPIDIAAGDFNNDGIIDIAVASRQGPTGVGVLLGVGDGTFKPVVTYLGRPQTALAVADFDGDGNADIVSVGSDYGGQGGTVLLGAGDGTFHSTDFESALFPQFVAVGDFNNDGRPDFVVAHFAVNHLSVFLGNGDGTFIQQPALPLTPNTGGALYNGLAIGDFDGDGNADIAYTGSGGPSVSVFLGVGDGTFRGAVNFAAGSQAAGSLVAAEFNGDGRTDLAVSNSSSLQILLAGTGVFPSVTTASLPDAMGGVPYSSALTAAGGTPPFEWSLSAGNPSVALSLSSNGTIAGTPFTNISARTYPFTVMVSGQNGSGFFSSRNLSIKVAAAFQINPFGLFIGEVGSPYSARLQATGGTPPYRDWMVIAGSLPPGLTLDPASGGFAGTPTTTGSFSFTLTVNDSAGLTSVPAKLAIFVDVKAMPQPMGVSNAASGRQATPSVVAIGGYLTIYGTGLASRYNPSATSLPLPTLLNQTQVTIGGIPMPLLYAASGQVNGLVPQTLTPNSSYPLVVTNGKAQSAPVTLVVKQLQPGIYTVDASGSGPGVVANALTAQLISVWTPAHASDYLSIYCTGLGPLQGPNGEVEPADGAAAPANLLFRTTAKLTATISGLSAPVLFSGLTPTFAGLYVVNVQVPVDVPTGSAVPLTITATDSRTGATAQSNEVTIAVQ